MTTSQATGLRSAPYISIPSRDPSTTVVPPPIKMSATLSRENAPFFPVIAVVGIPHHFRASAESSGARAAAAMSIERNTLERRRAHHFDIW